MKFPSPFAAFERGLRQDHAAEESRKLEELGIEPPAKKRGRKPKLTPSAPLVPMNVPGELAAQLQIIAESLGISRSCFMRLALAAAAQAVLEEIEESGGRVTLPLCLRVGREARGFYHPLRRIISRDRFESLRMPNCGALQKWLTWHPGDRTGQPMNRELSQPEGE